MGVPKPLLGGLNPSAQDWCKTKWGKGRGSILAMISVRLCDHGGKLLPLIHHGLHHSPFTWALPRYQDLAHGSIKYLSFSSAVYWHNPTSLLPPPQGYRLPLKLQEVLGAQEMQDLAPSPLRPSMATALHQENT